MLCAYIMAGGSGQRFWPLSTPEKPKQLLKIYSDKSMIRETVDRILPIIPAERIFIGTNIKQAKSIIEELPMVPEENVVIEPAFKDTAAAIGYGALFIKKRYSNACMVVLASDHLIKKEEKFRELLEIAVNEATENKTIVTLGIKPTYPETGYGYIETIEEAKLDTIYQVERFWEKPNKEHAEEYINAGNFLWNSGIFVFTINTIIEEIKRYMPKHNLLLKNIDDIIKQGYIKNELAVRTSIYFEKFQKISIDFGVMERSERVKVIPSDIGWNDIGSFCALADIFETDINGNVIRNSDTSLIDSFDNIIITESNKVGIIGVNNLVIIQTEGKLLVCDRSRVQDIKSLFQ